jgi:hypothetical protein
MLFDELPIAFPWYSKIEHQNRYNENVEPICDYKLITPRDALLPFEFTKPVAGNPTGWNIYEINTGALMATINVLTPVRKVTRAGLDYIYYNGSALSTSGGTLSLPPGYYYSRMAFAGSIYYYSEMFFIPEDAPLVGSAAVPYLKLEWWNLSDIPPIFYNDITGGLPYFVNRVYLDTFITASEPEIEEDGTRDGNDELIPTFQKAIIRYRVTFEAPDFLKKALTIMQMHDQIKLTTKNNIRAGIVRRINVTSALEANGGLSIVDLLFEETIAMVKKGCAQNMV